MSASNLSIYVLFCSNWVLQQILTKMGKYDCDVLLNSKYSSLPLFYVQV